MATFPGEAAVRSTLAFSVGGGMGKLNLERSTRDLSSTGNF